MALANSKSERIKELIKKLSADPKIKSAMAELKANSNAENAYYSKSFLDLMVYILKASGGFLGKRKAKVIIEVVEVTGFVISISLILKKNLFDRPEVRQYFNERWSGFKNQFDKLLIMSSKYVNQALKRQKD